MASPAFPHRIRFGVFEANLASGELCKDGLSEKILLQEQPLAILRALVARPGEMVSRVELVQLLWKGNTNVDFEPSLNKAINRLRESLGDSAEAPQYVETLSRRGYRFIAPVEALAPTSPRSQTVRWIGLGGVAGLTLLAAIVGLNVRGLRNRIIRGGTKPISSIAVLPLANLSNDPEQDYFADGMTEALITDLAQISSLRVISRVSVMHYKGTQKTMPEIASELHVDAIVEGSVVRSGDRIRITAQLIKSTTDQHIWAKTYERDLRDVLTLQDDIVRAIAQEIRFKLAPQTETRLARSRQVKPAAYDAYLKGRYYWDKGREEDFKKAVEYFERAVQEDPSSALGHAGLADTYVLLGDAFLQPAVAGPKAEAAARQALHVDDTLAEAHTSLALVLEYYHWDWLGAEIEFRRAIDLNPNSALAHQWYGDYLANMGKFEEASRELQEAQELEPLSLTIHTNMGWQFHLARQNDQAVEQLRLVLDLDPTFFPARIKLENVYAQMGKHREAVTQREQLVSLRGGPEFAAQIEEVFTKSGYRGILENYADGLIILSKRVYVSPYEIARVYVQLGDKERALTQLERAYEDHDSRLAYLKVDPIFDSLRSDSRFENLLRRVELPS